MSKIAKKRTWHAVDVIVEPDRVEAVECAFNAVNALGTEVDSLRKQTGEPLTVTGFFDDTPDMKTVGLAISDSLAVYGFDCEAIVNIQHRLVEETDWLAEWKKYWKPTEVGRFVIAPPWEMSVDSAKILITIEPNMAFGTGTHETTRLCLKAIDACYSPEMTFLDVGTGTGILAIAAAKIGGSAIFACDTDADSVKIARENGATNSVSNKIEFADGSIDDATPVHDFVCANLTLDVITPILPLLVSKARGILLLSGILADQRDSIEYELSKEQISEFQFEVAGEWCSVLVVKSEGVPVALAIS
ncbi:MAG: 50S ribosomal protein L11 methyltransferase [Pyrinomonadaceae bacterium]